MLYIFVSQIVYNAFKMHKMHHGIYTMVLCLFKLLYKLATFSDVGKVAKNKF